MTANRRYHGLRLKIAVSLLIPLVLVLAGTSYLRYVNYRRNLVENLKLSSASITKLITNSLLYAMARNDTLRIQQILDDAVNQTNVHKLLLIDHEGRVVFASDGRQLGETIRVFDAGSDGRGGNFAFTDSQDGRVLRHISMIQYGNISALVIDFSTSWVETQLTDYVYSRLVLSVSSVILILVTAGLTVDRIAVSRLKRFLDVVKRAAQGDLDARVAIESHDEIGKLAETFNHMADGLKEKEALEIKVRERTNELQAEKLAALNTIAFTVSQSLDLNEVLRNALEQVLALMRLKGGWIVLRNQGDGFDLAIKRGLPDRIALAQIKCIWNQHLCTEVARSGHPQTDLNVRTCFCPVADYCRQEGLIFRTCVPLKSKEHALGVMALFSDADSHMHELSDDTIEVLAAIGRQIGVAIENARLYEELREKDALRRQLLDKVISVQEDERRRIARELHDQIGQPLTSLLLTLTVLDESDAFPAPIHARLKDLRGIVSQTLRSVRNLALQLRPSVLDDLGLLAALRQYFRQYEDRFHTPVDFQVLGFDLDRVPSEVETALYRIVQEALTNVARHAQARSVSVLLENRRTSVKLIIEDDGIGFDVAKVMGSRARETNLGLYGMQERAALLGGTLTIESTPGMGTSVFVEIPTSREKYAEDSPIDR